MKRICNTCHVERDLEDFPIVFGCKQNRRPKCKVCIAEYHSAHNLKLNPIEKRPRQIAKELFGQGLKKCLECNKIKPLTEYWANSRWANGYNSRCKDCNREKFGIKPREGGTHPRYEYDREYRDKVRGRTKANRIARYTKSPRNVMQITLRHGLKRRPTENPATVDDLMRKFEAQDGKCAVSGVVMTWAQGKVLPTSISLDRIDPNEGYSDANLRLVCHAINAFKGRMTDDEMLAMARAIVAKADAESKEPTWQSFSVYTVGTWVQ